MDQLGRYELVPATTEESLDITHGVCDSPFGAVFMAVSAHGICWLGFIDQDQRQSLIDSALSEIHSRFGDCRLHARDDLICHWAGEIFRENGPGDVPFWVAGTGFQIKVWKALRAIPRGQVVSYGSIARKIGQPTASRAVGQAVGSNPVSILIPCHRVVRRDGQVGNYRWGTDRKKAILKWEAGK